MASPRPEPASYPDDAGDLSGSTVGRFAIRALIGRGGMGEVYRADDSKLRRTVALKRLKQQLRDDPAHRERILHEAQRASAINSPHVAGVHDVLENDGEVFLVMEYVEGESLRAELRKRGALPAEEFLPIAVQCVQALIAAHHKGVVHRDLKPDNIMLTPGGAVKVLDFGLAKRLPLLDESCETGSVAGREEFVGTPGYMAPEVLMEAPADHRADIFSLGVVFYEALTGQHPFRTGHLVITSDRVLHDQPPRMTPVDPLPPGLEAVVDRMMAKRAEDRYGSAAELLGDLQRVQRGELPAVRRARPRWFRTVLRTAAAVAVLLVIVSLLPVVRDQWRRWMGRGDLPGRKYVAVLPFRAINADDQDYAQGLTETLTAKLTQFTRDRELQVTPASEVRARGVTDLAKARSELGVNLVLEGSLHRVGSQARISFALVDAASRRQVRADVVTVAASDPFSMEDRVAEGVARMLELDLAEQEREVLASHGTVVADAYELYLRGRGRLLDYDKPENVESAIRDFKDALRLDPRYALAQAGLGEAYWKRFETSREEVWIKAAQDSCAAATELDARLAPARICLGTVANGTGRYEEAVREFQRALEAEPTSDAAYRGLAAVYQRLGRQAEAEQTFKRAISLRPHYWAGYSWLGAFYFAAGRYDDAAAMFRRVTELAPESFRGYYNLGGVYVAQGRYPEAIGVLERSVAMRPSAGGYSNLGTAYFYERRFGDAARSYEHAVKLDERDHMLWGNLADAYHWIPGKRQESRAAFQNALANANEKLQVNPRDRDILAWVAVYEAALGDARSARRHVSAALAGGPVSPELAYNAAATYLQLGDKGQAVQWLEKAVAAGLTPALIQNSPNWDPLRDDPGLKAILGPKRIPSSR